MNRWHEVSCLEPDVEVLPDKTICCRSCRQTPHAAELVAERATASSVPRVPPNKPLGLLRLWWPISVPYSVPTLPASDDAGQTSEASATSGSYSFTLGSNEIRLICIEAVNSHDYPLHLSLEVYDLDVCPEYEAVSYTWAGEDGDNTLCKPIYMGPFWDCLLQTKNCWEMLRFVRPWRGIRMLWVDAICINQNNVPERSSQVANMDRIYSSCSRVVVYLGPDITIPLHGRHARRGRLHELETGDITPVFPAQVRQPQPYRLKDLLSRRYFSRIWVIQELLLSRGAIMRVGDVDFWADAALSTRLSTDVPSWSWGRVPAAWVRYISQGASSVKDIKELLWITSLSMATDPRDRVFGLLGIMPELSTLKEAPTSDSDASTLRLGGFKADYSLPYNEVFIGLFGYCILNLRRPNILCHASCLWRVLHYPTWAPKWTSPATWRLLLQSPKATTEQFISLIQEIAAPKSRYDTRTFQLHDVGGPAHPDVQAERQWHQDASIDTSTGALSINLTHYMPLRSPVEKIGQFNGFFVFRFRADQFAVYLSSEHRLDELITGSGNEQLFILNKDDDSKIYLILRPIKHLDTCQLVAVCPFVAIETPWKSDPGIRRKDLQHSLYDTLIHVQSGLDDHMFLSSYHPSLYSKPTTFRDVLPALVALHREGPSDSWHIHNTVSKALRNAYLEHMDSKFSPRVSEEDYLITISSLWDEFPTYITKKTSWLSRDPDPNYSYRIKGEEEWRDACVSSATYKNLTQFGEKWIEVRFLHKWSFMWFSDGGPPSVTELFRNMDVLASASMHTGEDVLSMLTRAPVDEDLFTGCRNSHLYGFREVWNKLQLVGSTFMVSIE